MSKLKFPARRADGSFCVEVVTHINAVDGERLSRDIQQWWSDEWLVANRVWVRTWSNGKVETLRYEDEFSALPEIWDAGDGTLPFRLNGRPSARWWKDWLVMRILSDLKARFPQIGEVSEIHDCP